jgi:NADH dehydrogenase
MHWLKLTGLLGWLVWSVAHIYYLVGFRNRTIVTMNWVWNYLTLQRGTRLITGVTGSRIEDMAQCVPSRAAKADASDRAALPNPAASTLEHKNRQAPQSVQLDGPTDQGCAGKAPTNR